MTSERRPRSRSRGRSSFPAVPKWEGSNSRGEQSHYPAHRSQAPSDEFLQQRNSQRDGAHLDICSIFRRSESRSPSPKNDKAKDKVDAKVGKKGKPEAESKAETEPNWMMNAPNIEKEPKEKKKKSKKKKTKKSKKKKGKKKKKKASSSSSSSSASSSSSESESSDSSDSGDEGGNDRPSWIRYSWIEVCEASDLTLGQAAEEEESSEDEDEIGPKPAMNAAGGDLSQAGGAYGGRLMPGEGDAMAAFVKEGKRIPRRGEVGITADEIETLENVGYVMSGSRHRRMNAVRIRKENQVYSAEEKRALAMYTFEEKMNRETQLIGDLQDMLSATRKRMDDDKVGNFESSGKESSFS